MIIKIADVPPEGRQYEGEEPPSLLGFEEGAYVHVDGPVVYDLTAQVVPGELVVRGRLSVAVTFLCSRCGEPFPSTVKDRSFTCLRETKSDESVDLTDEIREAMILAFPNYPVCRPDCKGLCPRCGAGLNSETCKCSGKKKENTWAALDGLELK